MKVQDREAWRKFRAGQAKKRYEDGILSFAERWAGRMESRLTARVRVADVAGDTINDPTVRLTSLQIASAVAALIKFWVHGAELKVWYEGVVKVRKEARAKAEVCA